MTASAERVINSTVYCNTFLVCFMKINSCQRNDVKKICLDRYEVLRFVESQVYCF